MSPRVPASECTCPDSIHRKLAALGGDRDTIDPALCYRPEPTREETLERLVRVRLDMEGRACSDYLPSRSSHCAHPCCAWIEQAREALGISSPYLPPIVKGSPP